MAKGCAVAIHKLKMGPKRTAVDGNPRLPSDDNYNISRSLGRVGTRSTMLDTSPATARMTDELADRFDASSFEFDPRGNAILLGGDFSTGGTGTFPRRISIRAGPVCGEISLDRNLLQSDPDRWNVPTARQPQ